jgi:hypothetical protein
MYGGPGPGVHRRCAYFYIFFSSMKYAPIYMETIPFDIPDKGKYNGTNFVIFRVEKTPQYL